MKQSVKQKKRGITSIEVVFGVSIAGIVLMYSAYAITGFVNSARDVNEKTQALYLAEEGLELVRYIRDNNWANIGSLPLNTIRYLAVATTTVQTTLTPESIDGFTRSITVQSVYRDSSTDDIVASTTGGSVADTYSRYVTTTVSWGTPAKNVSLTTILTDIRI